MQFQEIPGHQPLKQKLISNIKNGKLPHALLFLGEAGSANLALALALAQYINCENPDPADSCGICPSCRRSRKKESPNIHFSFPIIGNKIIAQEFIELWRNTINNNIYLKEFDWYKALEAENKQGNINKAECVEIIKFTGLKTNANKKIIIVWKPEKLGKIGNILLKTIEEPPADTLIIMVASQTEPILGTILSRTQRINVPPIDDTTLSAYLKECFPNFSTDTSVLSMANGNIGKAIDLTLSNKENENREERLALWLRFCIKREVIKINNWVEEMAKSGRENQKNFLVYFSTFYNLALRSQLCGVSSNNLTDREQKMAQFLLRYMQWEEIQALATILDQAHYHITRNANPKILFFNISLDLMRFMNRKQ